MKRRHPRLCSLIAALSLGVSAMLTGSGCSVSRVDPAPAERSGHVFFVRGLMDVFSLGLNDMADDLRAEGYQARTISGPRWPDLAGKIKKAQADGTLDGPLVIVGHSLGGDDAVRLARKLDTYGVPIDSLTIIDAPNPAEIPPNVARVVNIYKPHGVDFVPIFRGVPVEARDPTTEVINFNLKDADDPALKKMSINHFSIEADKDIRQFVVDDIRRVLTQGTRASRPPLASPQPGG